MLCKACKKNEARWKPGDKVYADHGRLEKVIKYHVCEDCVSDWPLNSYNKADER